MKKSSTLLSAALLGVLAIAAGSPAEAQYVRNPWAAPQSAYPSQTSFTCPTYCGFSTAKYESPPSAYYYELGVRALGKHEYTFAIDMFKVAASWASKPAEYTLGVLYFRGDGVSADRPLGAAWMTLAAERGEPEYVKARDAMVGLLTDSELAQTHALLGDLRKTYADKVALVRANRQQRWDGAYSVTWMDSAGSASK